MKNRTKTQLLWVALVVLVIIAGYMYYNPKVVQVVKEVPIVVKPHHPIPTRDIRQEPEFRGPPIKKYKPGHMQQMGLLLGEGMTLPLYGKEVHGHRDRYHYYTTTSNGDSLYPVPISFNGRDCVDDIGCQELYGNESVTVTGKDGSFNTHMYRTDDFF